MAAVQYASVWFLATAENVAIMIRVERPLTAGAWLGAKHWDWTAVQLHTGV